jgi:hypothetical protein
MLSVVMLNVVMLIVIMVNVVMLSVVMLCIIMMNVMAPTCLPANITIVINYERKNFYRTEPLSPLQQSAEF